MSLTGLIDPVPIPDDGLASIVSTVIKIVAYSTLGVFLIGIVSTCWCCLFDGKKWKSCEGRSVFWRLMH